MSQVCQPVADDNCLTLCLDKSLRTRDVEVAHARKRPREPEEGRAIFSAFLFMLEAICPANICTCAGSTRCQKFREPSFSIASAISLLNTVGSVVKQDTYKDKDTLAM